MQVYPGSAALSDFRRAKLLARLQIINPAITAIEAEYVHLADLSSKKLSAKDDAQLQQLVTYGPAWRGPRGQNATLYFVIPRPGTISPWSSKATDIAHNAGLSQIRRLERGVAYHVQGAVAADNDAIVQLLHDRMTEAVAGSIEAASVLFETAEPAPLRVISVIEGGREALAQANQALGLALADDEINYLYQAYLGLQRDPTDVELMMFAQVNSEHCRHKIFNADWTVDDQPQPKTLFQMIKNTYEQGGAGVLSAYSDNAAVIGGPVAGRFFSDADHVYRAHQEPVHSVIKVETHNHPTAIAPIPGAATGIGGEIRDEAATGRGAKSKMGLSGFSVSNLDIPGAVQPWETPQQAYGKPDRVASALGIMLEAPIGGASYANEFGRPTLAGYFRTYQQTVGDKVLGYHKPIMVAGGLGNIRDQHVQKQQLPPGALVIVLGGPAMLIGLGGGAASSQQSGRASADLDFASVQRGNGELERRAQEVIDSCWALGDDNPIITIHDVGAGGLSNALPELVHDSGRGAVFELRDIPSAEPGLSPLEIWCNEAQERYVLGIQPADFERFAAICQRERTPFAVVGTVTEAPQLILTDALAKNTPIDLPMDVLFGKPPQLSRQAIHQAAPAKALQLDNIDLADAIARVLQLPAVASKKFLITIGDRTVGGLTTRDQLVGPWQVPVSDVAVTAVSFDSDGGEAMALGERAPVAVSNAPAAARLAVGEALTNLAAADIRQLSDIKLSANWMAAAGEAQADADLFDSVKTIGEDFCPALGLTIPVGKDSLSMRTSWRDGDTAKSVTAPLSLVITGFAPVASVRRTLTPELDTADDDTVLVLLDLSGGHQRLGGSALAQVYNQVGDETPDADPEILKQFFTKLRQLKQAGLLLAYHDRSDGGLLTTVLEMAFASRCGLQLDLANLAGSALEKLCNEELGAVIQVRQKDLPAVTKAFGDQARLIGRPLGSEEIVIQDGSETLYRSSRARLETLWAGTSYQLQRLRDNPATADQEYAAIADDVDPGLSPLHDFGFLSYQYDDRPRVAIFREQGVNGQTEMAAAFDRAGFTSVDVHLSDLVEKRVDLDDFVGLAACGGFSYGDVLGAGEGWAKSILFNDKLRRQFQKFFERPDTFTLGVCNGCQMLAALKELIPGAANWPAFQRNTSEQFEARVVMTQVNPTPSIFFRDMAGAQLPVPVAHGEGRAVFGTDNTGSQTTAEPAADPDTQTATDAPTQLAQNTGLIPLQYVDNYGRVTENYPANPNGSPHGITALTTPDGRATILMPHPERAFMTRQLSWHPPETPTAWGPASPWFRLFQNARQWVAENAAKPTK